MNTSLKFLYDEIIHYIKLLFIYINNYFDIYIYIFFFYFKAKNKMLKTDNNVIHELLMNERHDELNKK